jgi:predicted small lipoprotein YifL
MSLKSVLKQAVIAVAILALAGCGNSANKTETKKV